VINLWAAVLDQYVCRDNIQVLQTSERSEASVAKPNKGASHLNLDFLESYT
jgi:hypothetical protein